jgi:drug/metabolite transporter (DMT)-like permease
MQFESRPGNTDSYLSTKDTILGIIFAFSGLLSFALSFTLLHDNGRPYLFCSSLALCLVCLLLADRRKIIALGSVVFIVLRIVWSVLTTGLQIMQSGHH